MKHKALLFPAATVAAILLSGIAGPAAAAVPTPDSGPVAGGTVVQVPEPAGWSFTQVSTTVMQSFALSDQGVVYSWGSNAAGALGDGTRTDRNSPTPILAPAGVTFVQVEAGTNYGLALGDDGTAYSWGFNGNGRLGDGTTIDRLVPGEVLMPVGVTFTAIATGYDFAAALGSDGRTYSWGRNGNGRLGDGTMTDRYSPVPILTPAGVNFVQISLGDAHGLAIGDDGNAYVWGANFAGQYGNGTTTSSTTPVLIQPPTGVTFTRVIANGSSSFAIGDDGVTYAWGSNAEGRLGDGTTTDRTTPVQVLAPAGVTFTHISTGHQNSSSMAVGDDGKVYAWGSNADGVLGDGTTVSSLVPVAALTPEGVRVTSASLSWKYALARTEDGDIYSWGTNNYGQLGNGTNVASLTPVLVAHPGVVVTAVLFDGVAGSSLADAGTGQWNVSTPLHAAGPVDVVVEWSLDGVPQEPVTYVDGFTYVATLALTDPSDVTVAEGGTATFSVVATGDPVPTVVWEFSRDGGTTWESTTLDEAASVSADGQTVTVEATAGHTGYLYRAVASNGLTVTSASALLTVTVVVPGIGTGTGTDPQPVTTQSIPNLGADSRGLLIQGALGAAALLLGLVVLVARRRITRDERA